MSIASLESKARSKIYGYGSISRNNSRGFTIKGDYDYSGVIDQGLYPSPPSAGTGKTTGGYSIKNLRKARPKKGLVEPTVAFIERIIKKVIRRL